MICLCLIALMMIFAHSCFFFCSCYSLIRTSFACISENSCYNCSEPYCKIKQKSITGFLYSNMLFIDNRSMLPLIEIPFIVLSHQTTFPFILSLNRSRYIFGPNAINSCTYTPLTKLLARFLISHIK